MNRYQEYKDSEIDWVGEIPNHWILSRVGKFFTERSEKVDDVTYPPLSVTMSGIVDQLSDVAKTNDGENRKLVRKDDFVINSRSDRKGSSGIAPRDGSVSGHIQRSMGIPPVSKGQRTNENLVSEAINQTFETVARWCFKTCQRQSKIGPKGSAKCCHFGVGIISV